MKKRNHDPEGDILAMGWDTESTSSGKFRATRGASSTPWLDSWEEVLKFLSLAPA